MSQYVISERVDARLKSNISRARKFTALGVVAAFTIIAGGAVGLVSIGKPNKPEAVTAHNDVMTFYQPTTKTTVEAKAIIPTHVAALTPQ